jgi:hypothetical protein
MRNVLRFRLDFTTSLKTPDMLRWGYRTTPPMRLTASRAIGEIAAAFLPRHLYAIADARAKRKRKIEDELHRQVVETREERAKDERRKRWLQGDEW